MSLATGLLLIATWSTGAPPPPIGTPHPILVMAVASDASWVVACQARKDTDGDGKIGVRFGLHGDSFGDRLRPYVIAGSGPGEVVDDFVAVDGQGSHLAFVKRGKLLVRRMRDGATIDLSKAGADPGDGKSPLGPHRAAAFDDAGKQVLYLRRRKGRTRAVVRDLATGREIVLDHGQDRLHRAYLDGGGRWVWLQTVPRGRAVRAPQTSLAGRACRGPISSYSVMGSGGVTPDVSLVEVKPGARPIPATGLVGIYGAVRLTRDPDRGILRVGPDGSSEILVPRKACAGVMHAASADARHLLMDCAGDGKLTHVGPKGRRPLDVTFEVRKKDYGFAFGGRLLHAWRDRKTIAVDVVTGHVTTLGPETHFDALHGVHALARRQEYEGHHDAWLGIVNIATGETTTLKARVAKYPKGASNGRWIALEGHGGTRGPVIDLRAAKIVGAFDHEPKAISDDGRVLLADKPSRLGRSPDWGPVRWQKPRPWPGQ